jgi:hypothetical protein
MEKQTKTLLVLGAGALALYLILRPTGANAQSPNNDYMRSLPPDKQLCPEGQILQQVQCDQAPCPAICVDNREIQ